MDVRPLDADSIEDLVALCRRQAEETLPHLPFEDEVARGWCRWGLSPENTSMAAWLAYEGDVPVGYLIAARKPYLFNRLVMVSQEVVFVAPERRGSSAFLRLMRAFVAWGQLHGAAEIYAGVANGRNVETMDGMLRRLGFDTVGLYARIINHA